MGYFPNGISGEFYQEQYCQNCINEDQESERYCWIWNMHLLHNYEECNKDDSWLHKLIPREGIDNGQCVMFVPKTVAPQPDETLAPPSTAAKIRTLGELRAYQERNGHER